MKQKKIIPIELSQEDKKLLELQKEHMNKIMEMIIQASKIPSKYFDSNLDEK